MKRHLPIILIALLALGYFAWTLANPPAGTPGTGGGSIWADSLGNIGIKATPATLLDVNGTTTIRKTLDMTGNRIWNVATPTSSLDAANKAYVDLQVANISSSSVRVWGQGRPGTAVATTSAICASTAECYRDMDASGTCNAGDMKIARSSRISAWDKSAAACPSKWWVCTATDRDTNGATAGLGACGSTTRNGVDCVVTGTNEFPETGLATTTAWLADTATAANGSRGRVIGTAGTFSGDPSAEACAMFPVWCCSYQ